jgi:hypothetical protein
VPEQRVLLQGRLAQERLLAVVQMARASPQQVLERGMPPESQLVLEPRVSPRPEGAHAQPEKQEEQREREPVLAPVAFAELLLRQLPSRNGRLRRRFRHPPRPSGDA